MRKGLLVRGRRNSGVGAGRATREAALTALQGFAEDGTPMAGTILNDCKQHLADSTPKRKTSAAKRAVA